MRFLADESLTRQAVEALQELGHDVAWVLIDAPATPDRDVLARARAEDRILVTADTDYGELVFNQRLPAHMGVILMRTGGDPEIEAARLADAVRSRDDWRGYFGVVELERIRTKPVPDRTK